MPGYGQINWDKAECKGAPTNLFYIVEEDRSVLQLVQADSLRRICAVCPIFEACLDYGLENENYGVWGGLLTKERTALKSKLQTPLRKKAIQELQRLGLTLEKIEAMADEHTSNDGSMAYEFTYYREDDSISNR